PLPADQVLQGGIFRASPQPDLDPGGLAFDQDLTVAGFDTEQPAPLGCEYHGSRVRLRARGQSARPGRPPERNVMILSTMNDLPGYEVTEVLGEVFRITVRSQHVGSQIEAGFKSLVGGELRGMTKMLSDSRTEAQDRLIEAAQAKGGEAVLAM